MIGKLSRFSRTEEGFTLLELSIGITLAGILTAIALPAVSEGTSRVVTQSMRADALATKIEAEGQIRWDGAVMPEKVKVIQTGDNQTTFEQTGVFDYKIYVRNSGGSPTCVMLTSASTEGGQC